MHIYKYVLRHIESENSKNEKGGIIPKRRERQWYMKKEGKKHDKRNKDRLAHILLLNA